MWRRVVEMLNFVMPSVLGMALVTTITRAICEAAP